ncbi:MAG: AAA family ATPase [Bosea sp.]|jgi:hypothetical protein|nr:AAA family ATPase [Bosea sp. (in: a-proteobacteria)]MBN9471946.1 AAA family ATPase [Bosea sp. (in: a-proteobacteria)]
MREFLFGPAYQKEQVTLTIAGGGTGKTSLCIAEAVAMASGTDFLETPTRPLRVWIYNGEEPLDELDRRVRAAAIAQGLDHAELRESLFVNSGRGAKRIDLSKSVQNKGMQVNDELVRSLIDSIRGRIDVVIVDPFISTHSISENDNSGIDMMAKAWARIAEEGGCAVHLVHHTSKGGSSDSADASRGASSLAAAARYVRNLAQMSGAEARTSGVGEEERQSHVAIRVTKQNNTAVAGTRWIRLSAVAIGNDPDSGKPGDIVGVVQPFKPKVVEVDLTEWASAALDALGDSRHVYNFGSEKWFGFAVADQLGIDGKANRRQIESLIDFMLNLAAIETYNDPGKNTRERLCIRGVGPYATMRKEVAATPASRRVAAGKRKAAADALSTSDREDDPVAVEEA